MIRNFRGIDIRRIVQQVHFNHHCNTNHTGTRKNLHTYNQCLNISSLSKHSRIRNQIFERIVQHRWHTVHVPSSDIDEIVGHDYLQAPDSGPIISPINITDIHGYLFDRLVCLASRNSNRLRAIDEELENGNVFVDDIAKQWRADGKRFAVYLRKFDTNKNERAQIDQKSAYFRSPYSGPTLTTLSESEMHHLLAERHYRRRIRDYASAEQIRKQLESHCVFIDDKNRKWRGDRTKFLTQMHNYTKSRDSGLLKATITEEDIHNMLNARHRCRLRKDYRGADRIYENLKNCGVSIDDEIMEWRADGITFSKFLRFHGYKLASDAGTSIAVASEMDIHKLLAKHWSYKKSGKTKEANDTWEELSNIGVFLDVPAMVWRADGVKHNYRLSQGAGQNSSKATDNVIHTLLEKRMLHRWRSNFGEADLIRDKLQSYGVYINDINKEWRADGEIFNHFRHRYRQAPDSGPLLSTLSESTIQKLLSELWQLKSSRVFDKADLVSDELFDAGVYVNDKKELWRADGKTCNFTVIPWAGPFNTKGPIDEMQMHRMLEDSFRSRMRHNFAHANRIQDQLFHAGIFLDQRKNVYRADGIVHSYKKSPIAGPDTSLIAVDDIHRLLAERWRCRCKGSNDFENSDRIFVELYDSGVFVDDETMEWRADGIFHTYRQNPDGPIVSTLPMDEIHRLIGRRIRHKKFKDFVKADRILQYLKGAKVYLNDKKKEWRADGGTYDPVSKQRQMSSGRFNHSTVRVGSKEGMKPQRNGNGALMASQWTYQYR